MHETHEGEARGRRHSSSSNSVDKLQASSTRSRSSSRETVKSHSENKTALVNSALTDIQHIRETHKYLEKSLKTLRTEYQRDHNQMLHALEEERSRLNGLERELAYLTELHQRETSNLKEEISSTKKIIDIRYNGKAEEFSEALEKCQSHLLKMELQQQQEMDIVRHEDSIAQIILEKLIRLLLVVMSTILVFVCTLNQGILFFKSSKHILSAVLLAAFLFLLYKYWNTVS
ncbi:transmembrane and coiled-coil domains protein 1-like isoform X1 [Xiphophorus couchianus]|uniref:transmembrane and coiled-coil domains protein 1-like isoform X1 n=1 Tax=Xiphophorus couchianus TaxID=32473 RepID=UPI001016D3F0|nr:transmembrane and coiled-coil domains protein 1-like isoform X1 [Xiphophorus couchianus]